MSIGASIRRNTAWVLGGNVASRVFKFAIGIVLARLLVPEDFGLLVTIQIFTGVAGFLASGGMGEALVQAPAVDKRHFRTVFTAQLLVCGLIYLFFFHSAPGFARWFDEPRYLDLMRVAALSFLIRPFANVPRARLRRDMRFQDIIFTNLFGLLAGSGTSVAMALAGMGAWSLVVGGLVGALVNAAAFNVQSGFPLGIHFDREIMRTLGLYGVRATATGILVHLRSHAPNFVISRALGPADVGLFNKGASLADMPVQIVSGSAYQTVFRALSSLQSDLDKSRYVYLRTLTLVCVYAFPLYVGLFWLAESFIVTVYGAKWAAAAGPLQVLALAGLLRPISNISGAVIAARNQLQREIRVQLESLLLLAIGCFAGLQWGIAGVAFGATPSLLWSCWRMSGVACACLNLGRRDVARALQPALRLNAALFAVLALGDLGLQHFVTGAVSQLTVHFLALASLGFIFYVIAFLGIPPAALAEESNRWRRLLKLPSRQVV